MTRSSFIVVTCLVSIAWTHARTTELRTPEPRNPGTLEPRNPGTQELRNSKTGGYIIERDAEVARQEGGPHNGGGQTIGHSFFAKVPKMEIVFRKRVLKPGSGIGYHEQKEDEIYYVLSGRGVMTLDGKDHDVGPGTAILTRPGSSHGLKVVGGEDLVIIINYLQEPK